MSASDCGGYPDLTKYEVKEVKCLRKVSEGRILTVLLRRGNARRNVDLLLQIEDRCIVNVYLQGSCTFRVAQADWSHVLCRKNTL